MSDINPIPNPYDPHRLKATVKGGLGETVLVNTPGFRVGTQTERREYLFQLSNGGMGDFICWMVSILWVARNYNFIDGIIVCPLWFTTIVNNLLKPHPRWKVYADKIPDKYAEGYPIKRAEVHPINATTMNLIELGYLYYPGIFPVPEDGWAYPVLDLEGVKTHKKIKKLDEEYVILTPGMNAKSRRMSASAFNMLKDYVIERGFMPVLLGKKEMGTRKIIFDDSYDYSGCLDLRDETGLLQAAKVIDGAKFIVGIDNGLLHLAAMTNCPIIFGYTVAGPRHRRPIKPNLKLVEVYLEPKELACTFCQERVRFFMDHNFENCIYKDYKCIQMLDGETWVSAVDSMLGMLDDIKSDSGGHEAAHAIKS